MADPGRRTRFTFARHLREPPGGDAVKGLHAARKATSTSRGSRRLPARVTSDPTVLAIPAYFAAMGIEYLALRRAAGRRGPSAGDYERRDTVTSITMGLTSLLAPVVVKRLLAPFRWGRSRTATATAALALGAVAVTTVADRRVRDSERSGVGTLAGPDPVTDHRIHVPAGDGEPGADGATSGTTAGADIAGSARQGESARWRTVASVGGCVAVAAGGAVVLATWIDRTSSGRMWRRRLLPDLGTGPLGLFAAVAGWDLFYYWNHRLDHQCRFLWASHVVHHSSERYNLSTALRQPVTGEVGTAIPDGLLCLFGVAPTLLPVARGINLLYQFWVHTETIDRCGPAEAVMLTPSHHRVHHGSNRRYLDRNHGSILIVWDRLFGTFQLEEEPVVYGLTKNIGSFSPLRVAGHEWAALGRDLWHSRSWAERLSFVLRGPGWAASHRRVTEESRPAGAPDLVPSLPDGLRVAGVHADVDVDVSA